MLSSGIFFLGWWGRGQPEVFMLLPLVGMIYFLRPVESREKEVFPVLLAGITGGIAFSLKSTIVPLLLLICLTLGLEGWLDSKQIRKGIVRMLLFSLGVIIILTPFFIFFLVNGALEDLFFANVTFNLATHINHPLTIGFVRNFINKIYLIGTRIPLLWVTILVLALYGIVRIGNVEKKKRLILIMWFAGILLSIGFGWWLFLYHFIVLIPPLTLLASFGFFQLLDQLSSQRRTIHQISRKLILYLLIPFLLIEFLFFYIHVYCDTGIIPSLIGTEKINREELYSRFRVQELPINDFSFSDDYRLSRYLQNHTHEKEKIFVWGWESLVYFLSEREPASRYIFIYPLIQNNLDLGRGAQKIFWEELNEKKPRYFIVAKKDQNPLDEIGSEKRLSLFPELRHFLQGQYLKENETERFVIYRRVK
jgi:hypothetical protein